MTQLTAPADRTATSRWTTWRAPVRVVLWLLLVGSVLFALWGTPRYTSQDGFARALKSGDVLAVSTSGYAKYGLEAGLSGVSTASSSTAVVWEDTGGRLHRTDLAELANGIPGDVAAPVDVPATITATAAAAGHAGLQVDGDLGPAQWSALPLSALVLVALGLLIVGPQPRRVTKWGMFWLLWIPLGGGLAWWLARDAAFVARLQAATAPVRRARGDMPYGIRRVGGGVTVLAAVGVSILLAFAIAIVLGLASNPGGPSSSTEPWHAVPAAQQPLTSP